MVLSVEQVSALLPHSATAEEPEVTPPTSSVISVVDSFGRHLADLAAAAFFCLSREITVGDVFTYSG